jgi:GNAT superfamily N-acetyltransferase
VQRNLPVETPQPEKLTLTAPPGKARPKVTRTVEEATGEHTYSTGKGHALAQENGDFIQIRRLDVEKGARRQGAASAILEDALKDAKSRGLRGVSSDVSVSPDQVKVYEDLARRGFKIKRNPSKVNPQTGNTVSADPRKSVFEVLSTPQTAE